MKYPHKGLSLIYTALLTLTGYLSVSFPVIISLVCGVTVFMAMYALAVGKIEWLWYGVTASPMLEVWARMAKAPFVPLESGKYFLLIVIALLLIHHIRNNSFTPLYHVGGVIILLLLPGLVVALNRFDFEEWVFNILGLLELGTLLMFTARERWEMGQFCKMLWFGLLPVIPILAYLTIKTPSYNDLNFVIGANFEAGGGFGSNQVSTILGNGIVLTIILIFLNYPIFRFKLLSFLLLGFLLFRGMLTFSRGGIIGAGLAVLFLIIPAMLSSPKAFFRYALFGALLTSFAFAIFSNINGRSGNKLLLRYQGETPGTFAGSRQRTLNTITSGRFNIVQGDLKIFTENFWFGVGPGLAKKLRVIYSPNDETVSHTEFSRLLSEHGIGGLIVALVLLIFPVSWIRKQQLSLWRSVSAALFVLALFTSFHSAMRTNTTTVYYALAAMPVLLNKEWLEKFQ